MVNARGFLEEKLFLPVDLVPFYAIREERNDERRRRGSSSKCVKDYMLVKMIRI
jgi:hypothetical protein